MGSNQQYARTVRIAIPVKDGGAGAPKTIPPVGRTKPPGQTSWIVTQSGEMGSDRYQELLHSLYDGVLITTAAGQIVDINARAISLLRFAKEELSGMKVTDIIVGADELLLKTICKNIESNRFTLIDAYCKRKDQSTFPAEIATNRLVLTKEGHLCFFLRDVTRRKKAEEELIHTVSKLKELDTAKSRLVSNVSHELRTPLTIISSFVSLVHDGVTGAITDQQKECLATALRNCERLANLIDDVLDLGRLESGREEFKRRRLRLPELLRQCHHDFLPKCLLKQQQFDLELPQGEFPDALGDAAKIAQVMTNLVGNAHKFTPEKGVIGVRLSSDAQNACVEVSDSGPGISSSDQERLFEAFSQIDRPVPAAGTKGTGLGLTISKHIVEAHEGTLRVDSAEGRGSRFFFTLPLYTERKAFEAFAGDRVKFMKARNRKPTLTVLGYSAAQSAADHIQAAMAAALGCPESHVLLLESQGLAVALTDNADFNRGSFVSHLQFELGARFKDNMPEVSVACLRPDTALSPWEWLAEAKKNLATVGAGAGAEPVRRILIVDDDPAISKMMTDIVRRIGKHIEVRSCVTGKQACMTAREWKPNLVILDLRLPDISGKEVYATIASDDPGRTIKFMAVSGYTDDIREIVALGCDASLSKPFDFNEFVSSVKRLLAMSVPPQA